MFDSNGDGRFDPGDAAWNSAMGSGSNRNGNNKGSGNKPGSDAEFLGIIVIIIFAAIVIVSC